MAVVYSNFFGGAFFGGGFFGGGTETASGGRPQIPFSAHARAQTKEQLRESRERFGITEPAQKVIAAVARRQVEANVLDEQKRLEELTRQLELEGIEWDTRYLEALAQMRELLLTEALKAQFTMMQDEQDAIALMLIAAAA